MCFLWQHGIYLWYLPGTACLYSAPSPADLACLRNHLLHACRYWYCGCHPQDIAIGRDRTLYSFSSIRAVVYGFSSKMRSKLVGLRRVILVFIFFTRTRMIRTYPRTMYEAKQGCGVVSCTTFSCWGACWSKVLVLTYDIICMMCTWGLLLLIFHGNISFL